MLSLLRDGLTNREIAHRLGISRAGAAYHVSEILSKLQVRSREEAAAWSPEAEVLSQRRWRVPAPAFVPAMLQRLLAGSVAKAVGGAVLAGASVALVLLALGVFEMSQRDAPGADATATVQAQAPEATPNPEESPLQPATDGFVRRDLAPGEVPDEEHGVLFVDTASGAAELWRLPGPDLFPGPRYEVDAGHRWLFAWSIEHSSQVVDRETGRTYEFDGFIALPTSDGLMAVPDGDEYAVMDLTNDPPTVAHRFSLPSVVEPSPSLLLDDRYVLVAGYRVDLQTGDVLLMTDYNSQLRTLLNAPGDDWAQLALSMSGLVYRRYDQAGVLRWQHVMPAGHNPASFEASPDGRWLAWTEHLSFPMPSGMGGVLHWPVVVIADTENGVITARLLRGSTSRIGPMRPLGWLLDSSAVVVATDAGFARFGTDASLSSLPFEVTEVWEPGTVPAAHDAGLFLYRGRVFDAAGGALSLEVAAADAWSRIPLAQAGLNRSGTELRVVRSVPVPGGSGPTQVSRLGLPPKPEQPPFDEVVRLRVGNGGAALAVRVLPGDDETLLGQIPDGAVVTVTEGMGHQACLQIEEDVAPGCSVEPDPEAPYDTAWWVHIRADDGLEGWVSAGALIWAD